MKKNAVYIRGEVKMPNMSHKKVMMPHQEPEIRSKNFDEVATGYTLDLAKEEAERCLNCKNSPCIEGCPVNVQIPSFIDYIKKGDIESAYKTIKLTNSLPAVCGRVCPQERQCESKCVRGIKGESVSIGRLERFAADWYMKNCDEKPEKTKNNGLKVAVIGSGPAGLTCAGDLAKMGYKVTVFEAFHVAGGVLMYGIPEFRLPKKIVQKEIKSLINLGVEIKTNMVIGKIFSIDELFENGYKAVFIGSGAGLPNFMGIQGEDLCGVYSANEFLTRINLMKAYKDEYDTPITNAEKIAVIGGGNVAMDAARSAQRLKNTKKVYIIYRRGIDELPARAEEVLHAQEEGIEFIFLASPLEIKSDGKGWVSGMICERMELSEPDKDGRRKPVPIKNSEFELDIDCVIMSIGTSPNPLLTRTTPGLLTNKIGCIYTKGDDGATERPGVFAGGDAVTGAATVILAMGAGKKAAAAIDKYIKETN